MRRFRFMSQSLAALAVSLLALQSCSRQPAEVLLKDTKTVDGKWQYEGMPYTGVITDAYKDGKPRVRWEVQKGLLHGVVREWWQNGQQSTETHFDEGKRHGLNRYWDKQGVLMKEQVYEYDVSVSEKLWPNGKPAGVE
jgi:antitoxin component YwqK of YwqJK toxin-antitoxin module